MQKSQINQKKKFLKKTPYHHQTEYKPDTISVSIYSVIVI